MTFTTNAINLITEFEGLKLEAYQDQGGVWTIGYGHTFAVHAGLTISKIQATLYLRSDLISVTACLDKTLKVPVTQNQYDALTCFVFNLGETHFLQSSVLANINKSNFKQAAESFLLWDEIKHKVSKGLLNRRMAEKALFEKV